MYNSALIETFDAIINEFDKYSDRLIDREEFNKKLNNFIEKYDMFKTFDMKEYNIKKYIKVKINVK